MLTMTPAQTKDFIACLQRNLKKLPRKRSAPVISIGDVQAVWDHWKTTMSRPRAMLTAERKHKIEARLKDYSVDDIKRAIDGCKASPHHQGQNEHGTKYTDIELICRTGSKLEQFMELCPKAKASPPVQHPPECVCGGAGLIVVQGRGAKRCTAPNLPKGE